MKTLLMLALPLLPLAAAPTDRYPDGYWERGYPSGPTHAVSYNIALNVKAPDQAQRQIDRLMQEAGAVSRGGSDVHYGGQDGRPRRGRSANYTIASSRAEAAAKKIIAVGQLQNYNTHRQVQKSSFDEVQQKIGELEAELETNARPLKDMPIASHLMYSQLRRLKQSRDAMQEGMGKSNISVTLILLDGDKKDD
jgi:hypothetical protein